MKVFRNVYFKKDILQPGIGRGLVDVQYYGNLYGNCRQLKDFNKQFDRTLDLIIDCNECAKRKYRNFVKVPRP